MTSTRAEHVELLLEKGVHRYGIDPKTSQWGDYENDDPARGRLAAHLLREHPEIARHDIHTAVLASDVDLVRDLLSRDPSLATKPHPFDGWPPLMRLAYARIPEANSNSSSNAIIIAKMLLGAGAEANAGSLEGDASGFRPLTGAIGGGEADQPPHPQARDLAKLLIEYGADPLDGQALYNTSLGQDDTFWLDLLWGECEKRGDDTAARWHTDMTDGTLPAPPLEYLLGNAIPDQPMRARWLLEHGADPNAVNAYSKIPLTELAAQEGRQDMVDLLTRHGGNTRKLTDPEHLIAAVYQNDVARLTQMANDHPELLHSGSRAMAAAIKTDNLKMVTSLLDLGMSPNIIGEEDGLSALHKTAHTRGDGTAGIAKLLITRGAEVDVIDKQFRATPLGHAIYHKKPDIIAVLAPASRDIPSLCRAGQVERLRKLFSEDLSLANKATGGDGLPPLFHLPPMNEEGKARQVVSLLLSYGADPLVMNKDGLTPGEVAREAGLKEAAAMLQNQ